VWDAAGMLNGYEKIVAARVSRRMVWDGTFA
jgi:hypothetical protein